MFKSNIFFTTCMFFSLQVVSQCVPDVNFIPLGTNYGLSPDTLATGYVNQNYEQDLTFVLPLDTLVEIDGFGENLISFEDYHITSISLPIGLSWQCNNYDLNCHYDPSVSQYGCVNLYGVPLQYGEFSVDVTVIATHELSWAVGTEEITFSLPLNILPNISANSGFAMTNFSGCAPLTVDFINNNPGLESYHWDFGNGNVSSLENPNSQLYSQPGTYEVHYVAHSTIEPSYFLTGVEIQNASDWGNEFPDEENLGVFGLGSPDFYFTITDEFQNIIYQSNVLEEQNLPVTYNVDNLQLFNQNYTINVFEEDGVISDNDFCGSVNFEGFSNSATLTNGNLVVNYTTDNIQPTPLADVIDTIYVYDSPSQPSFSYDEENVLLSLDSDSMDFDYQWYYIQSPIPDAHNINFIPNNSGYYYILATNEFGCSTPSDEQVVVVCDDFSPDLQINSDTISFMQSSVFEYQWFYEGEQMFGLNSSSIVVEMIGNYNLLLIDQWGCKYYSNNIYFNPASVYDKTNSNFSVFPNPATDYLEIIIHENQTSFYFELIDFHGKKVISKHIPNTKHSLDLESLSRGTYFLNLIVNGQKITERIIIN